MATDPICGMYVDERTALLRITQENRTHFFCSTSCLQEFADPDRRLAQLRRKLAIAWPLAAFVVVLEYVWHPPGGVYLAFVLASIVQFYPGLTFYLGLRDAIRSRSWNMDVLIAVGTSLAYGYSTAALLFPAALPPVYYFDASALIIAAILTGHYLEHLTRTRASRALRLLPEMLPTVATCIRDGREVEIPVAELVVGDACRVRPGARFPVDGVVRHGNSSVIEAVVTGESLPQEKSPGSPIVAGTINGEGLLEITATRVGDDTFLAQVGQLVADAETSQVPIQRLADRIAERFVPAVLALSVAAALGWWFLGADLTIAMLIVVSVVITACPCAFSLATPAAVIMGTGRAAQEGILFKGRDSLERAALVDVVLTDKTGTLTRGAPELTDLVPTSDFSLVELLGLAAGLETGSEHPLAGAVLKEAKRRGVNPARVDDIAVHPGRGVVGRREGREVAILPGRVALETQVSLAGLADSARRLGESGRAWSVVMDSDRAVGLLGFFDEVKPGVADAVRALAKDGIDVVMVTGDHAEAARLVAEKAGIERYHANCAPKDKLDLLHRYQRDGRRVAFVGDGINDAPALTAADLGIAIGSGTDVARESGRVVLVRSDFRGVALTLRIGRRTIAKIRQNLWWALGYNGVLLPIAAGLLVPFLGFGVYNYLPVTGAVAMALSSTSVILNSFSLRRVSLHVSTKASVLVTSPLAASASS